MDRNEPFVIALSDCRPCIHLTHIATPSLFHIDDHLLERIRLFLDLTTADGREQEPRVFIYVRLGCVYFATGLAGEVFLRFAILHGLGPHDSAVDDHVFVNVAIPHVSDRA